MSSLAASITAGGERKWEEERNEIEIGSAW
jgi:hypothetical protein